MLSQKDKEQSGSKIKLLITTLGIFVIATTLILFVFLQSSNNSSTPLQNSNNTPQTPYNDPTITTPTSKTSIPVLPYTTLTSFITTLKSSIPRSGTESFSPPSSSNKLIFSTLIQQLLLNQLNEVPSEISTINYKLFSLFDENYSKNYLILLEKQQNFTGQGTYIINPSFSSNLILEVPHPLFDLNTLEESIKIMQELNGRAVFISGTHRCSNFEYSECSGTTSVCNNGNSLPFRISDVSHYTNNFFQEAHNASLQLHSSSLSLLSPSLPSPLSSLSSPSSQSNNNNININNNNNINDINYIALNETTMEMIIISVHGNGDSSIADVMLSDGTDQISDANSLVNRIRKRLIELGVSVASCNSKEDENENIKLCGTSNVQGRLSNGSPDPCLVSSDHSSGLFIHLEQHSNIRNDPTDLIIALGDVISSV